MGRKKKEPKRIRYWGPQEGPQTWAVSCPANEIFFGGTRGGGKTDALLGRHIEGGDKYGFAWNGLVVRKKYKEFKEIRRRINEIRSLGHPSELIGGENQINYWRFTNGATVTLAAIGSVKEVEDWQGQQFTEISIDEGPAIPYIAPLIDSLKGCLRSPHGIPCSIFITGNPGGPGAAQIKSMYIPIEDGGEVGVPEGQVNYIEHTLRNRKIVKTSRVFIRSTLWDNYLLLEADPEYEARLRSIHNPQLVKAWLDGRWDVFIGQAFDFGRRHIIPPIWPIPEHAPIYMTFDWGYGAPFSIGWWWVDGDGRVIRFAEWYGCDENTPNVGLRLTDQEIADGIIKKEKEMKIGKRNIIRIAGKDCWSKKPDYKGGGQGPATEEIFAQKGLLMTPGDPSKELKIRQFRNRLLVPNEPDNLPMLVIYENCKHFIRTIPSLCVDELTQEYLEDGQEDHVFDESCHICMARPLSMILPEGLPSPAEIDFMKVRGEHDKIEAYEEEMDRRINPELYDEYGGVDEEELCFNL